GCARTAAQIALIAPHLSSTFAPGDSVSYDCSLAGVSASFTNTAVATGTDETDQDVTAQDSADVRVINPHVTILNTPDQQTTVKGPNSQTVNNGGTATFTITVLNTGDTTLTDVAVTDARSPNCNNTIGTLAPGQSVSYKCTRPNVTSSFTNVAVVTGKAGSTTLTAQDTAAVTARAPFVPKVVPKVVSHKKPKATG